MFWKFSSSSLLNANLLQIKGQLPLPIGQILPFQVVDEHTLRKKSSSSNSNSNSGSMDNVNLGDGSGSSGGSGGAGGSSSNDVSVDPNPQPMRGKHFRKIEKYIFGYSTVQLPVDGRTVALSRDK